MSAPSDSFIVSIDVGSSSVRALLFDSGARQMEGYGAQIPIASGPLPMAARKSIPMRLPS